MKTNIASQYNAIDDLWPEEKFEWFSSQVVCLFHQNCSFWMYNKPQRAPFTQGCRIREPGGWRPHGHDAVINYDVFFHRGEMIFIAANTAVK